jgi:hypothetical protein
MTAKNPGAAGTATGAMCLQAAAVGTRKITEAKYERHSANRLRFLAQHFGLHGATAATVARLAWGAGKWT